MDHRAALKETHLLMCSEIFILLRFLSSTQILDDINICLAVSTKHNSCIRHEQAGSEQDPRLGTEGRKCSC